MTVLACPSCKCAVPVDSDVCPYCGGEVVETEVP